MGGEDSSDFGGRLRQLRDAAGLTQAELAERAGISVKAVSALERGDRRRPYPNTIRSLANALELSEAERAELAGTIPARRPAIRSIQPSHAPLPAPPTPIIGRERELTEVIDRLRSDSIRMVTLTGPGGVGKTRLALEVISRLTDTFAGRAAFVPLAPLNDPNLVASTVVQALGLTETAGTSALATLAADLQGQPWLLALDNLEHLTAVAPELADLLAACPRLSLLVTSRAPLKIRAEHEYSVRPLALPALSDPTGVDEIAHVSSVQLFRERARAAAPQFELTASNCEPVAMICRRLDGLPLALELAAARVRVLSPTELLARLDHVLPLLVAGSRDLPQRQQTIEAAINWSYELLRAAERALFRRLSVFAGGWTLEAAESVTAWGEISAGNVIDLLTGLVEQSLVVAETTASDETRYHMLEPIRQFASALADRLGERIELANRHLDWCLALAQRAAPELRGSGQQKWLDCLEGEHDNLRAALAWAGQDTSLAVSQLVLATALWRFWAMRGYLSEGRRWLEQALTPHDGVPPERRAAGLNAAGNLARDQGDHARASTLHEECLALYRSLGDERGVANALNNLGTVMLDLGNVKRATLLYDEALSLFRKLEADWEVAIALHNLGMTLGDRGQFEKAAAYLDEALTLWERLQERASRARTLDAQGELARKRGDLAHAASLHEESLAVRRELGDTRGIAISLKNLGLVAHYRRDELNATRLIEESLQIRRFIGDRVGAAVAISALAEVARRRGDVDRARALYREAIEARRRLKVSAGLAECLFGLAAIAEASGDHSRAARLVGASDALRDELGQVIPPVDRDDCECTIASIQTHLSTDEFEAAREAGRKLLVEQAIAEALGDH